MAGGNRLSRFQERLFDLQEAASVPQQIANRRSGFADSVDNLDLDLPDGTPLLRGITFRTGPRRSRVDYWSDRYGQEHFAQSNGRSLAVRPW